ncbi:hypothetical protein BVRB_029850 [Beta vulgaris subsp. vulgaris]|uniref:Uncharacterized protein n=1 Tax=Beta vulgaris subsp. vulgaris TaxID=3555 RepID=A0A0J8AXP8_BETVV|nr:hypothetical protein BVRB_029850 [Beta vulgaris subsp. vulgaris]
MALSTPTGTTTSSLIGRSEGIIDGGGCCMMTDRGSAIIGDEDKQGSITGGDSCMKTVEGSVVNDLEGEHDVRDRGAFCRASATNEESDAAASARGSADTAARGSADTAARGSADTTARGSADTAHGAVRGMIAGRGSAADEESDGAASARGSADTAHGAAPGMTAGRGSAADALSEEATSCMLVTGARGSATGNGSDGAASPVMAGRGCDITKEEAEQVIDSDGDRLVAISNSEPGPHVSLS